MLAGMMDISFAAKFFSSRSLMTFVEKVFPGKGSGRIDGSQHRWFCAECWYDLLVIMEETTREIYYAQLVEEESTRTVLTALREVIEQKGLFCALHSDRASHFLVTAKTGKSALITDYEVKVWKPSRAIDTRVAH
jgi:hypothetical protein